MKFISLLPTEANNNYQGLKFALWFFYLYLALVAFRSFTHMFAQDAGLNSIASIIIFPEVNFDKVDKIRGLDITIVTTSKTKEGALELLKEFNFPINNKKN